MAAAAAEGRMPALASARASAASKSSIPCKRPWSEKTPRIFSVVNNGSSRRCERAALKTDSSSTGAGFRIQSRTTERSTGLSQRRSAIEEYGLVLSLNDDVPFQNALFASNALREQGCTPLRGDQFQHGVVGVGWLVGEVDAGDQMLQEPPHEDGYDDVRSLEHAAGSWHGTRLHGDKAKAAIASREAATETAKGLVDRFVLCVLRVSVLALSVGLPDLDHTVVNRLAVAVEHTAAQRDALARRARGCEIFDRERLEADLQVRTDGLRGRSDQTHVGLLAPGGFHRRRVAAA